MDDEIPHQGDQSAVFCPDGFPGALLREARKKGFFIVRDQNETTFLAFPKDGIAGGMLVDFSNIHGDGTICYGENGSSLGTGFSQGRADVSPFLPPESQIKGPVGFTNDLPRLSEDLFVPQDVLGGDLFVCGLGFDLLEMLFQIDDGRLKVRRTFFNGIGDGSRKITDRMRFQRNEEILLEEAVDHGVDFGRRDAGLLAEFVAGHIPPLQEREVSFGFKGGEPQFMEGRNEVIHENAAQRKGTIPRGRLSIFLLPKVDKIVEKGFGV